MTINGLKKIMKEKNIDVAIFYNIDSENFNKNMHYYSDYKGIGCLAVPEKGSPFLIAPLMEVERARKSSSVKVYEWEKGKRLFDVLNEKLKGKPKTMGVVYRDLSYDVYKSLRKHVKKVKIVDITEECFEIRSEKSEKEIKIIKKSCTIASGILKKCINNFSKFSTEKDVETFLHTETIKNGCELAFPTIVASGKGGSMPHYEPKNVKLRKGFCVIDFGVKYEGYCSDITRTIYLGKPSVQEKKIYDILLNAQQKTIKKIKKGMKCSDVFQECIVLLREYADNFTHGLGHGIGLNIHEMPNLKPLSEEVIKENMIFTVEPGVYFENKFGIRIEDDILIKNGRPVILTNVAKGFIIKEIKR